MNKNSMSVAKIGIEFKFFFSNSSILERISAFKYNHFFIKDAMDSVIQDCHVLTVTQL